MRRGGFRRFAIGLLAVMLALTLSSCGSQPGPSGGPKIDMSKPFPKGIRGSAKPLIGPADGFRPGGESIGKMGVLCGYSHMGFFDPIVSPGKPTTAHLHTFYGNMSLNENTTKDNILQGERGSCRPGTLDLSGYWVPSLIDTRAGQNTPARPVELLAYYRSGYTGLDSTAMVTPPLGLKIITGDAKATDKIAGKDYRSGRWSCTYPEPQNLRPGQKPPPRVDTGPSIQDHIAPNCPSGYMLNMEFFTPQCWQGWRDAAKTDPILDSPDHKSHIIYDRNGEGCPASHPVVLPSLTTVFRFQIPDGATGKDMRLSSDMYDTSKPGGYSLHMDWFNGWEPTTIEKFMNWCIRPGRDCVNQPAEKERWTTYEEQPSNEIP
jgi:hypothetical protein